jgi:hypothetical protein
MLRLFMTRQLGIIVGLDLISGLLTVGWLEIYTKNNAAGRCRSWSLYLWKESLGRIQFALGIELYHTIYLPLDFLREMRPWNLVIWTIRFSKFLHINRQTRLVTPFNNLRYYILFLKEWIFGTFFQSPLIIEKLRRKVLYSKFHYLTCFCIITL